MKWWYCSRSVCVQACTQVSDTIHRVLLFALAFSTDACVWAKSNNIWFLKYIFDSFFLYGTLYYKYRLCCVLIRRFSVFSVREVSKTRLYHLDFHLLHQTVKETNETTRITATTREMTITIKWLSVSFTEKKRGIPSKRNIKHSLITIMKSFIKTKCFYSQNSSSYAG